MKKVLISLNKKLPSGREMVELNKKLQHTPTHNSKDIPKESVKRTGTKQCNTEKPQLFNLKTLIFEKFHSVPQLLIDLVL